MKLVIICDSNIGNHAFKNNEEAKRYLLCETQLIRSNTMSTFNDFLEDMPECDLLVVATVLNQVSFLEKNWSGKFDDSKLNDVRKLVSDMSKSINELAARVTNTRIWIMPAFIRTSPAWIESVISCVNTTFDEELEGEGISVLESAPIVKEDLSVDGVHLVAHGLNKLKVYLKKVVDLYKSTYLVTREVTASGRKRTRQDDDSQEGPSPSSNNLTIDQKLDLLLSNNSEFLSKFSKMEDDIMSVTKASQEIKRQLNNNLISDAREAEEKDEARNFCRRNCIIIRGLAIPPSHPSQNLTQCASAFINEELSKLAMMNKSDIKASSVSFLPIVVEEGFFSPVRIVFETAADAVEARKRIITANRAGNQTWCNVDVQNDPVKATRVRIHLMSCIARSLREEGYEVALIRFSDSPTIIVRKDKSSSGHLTFVDSILKYGNKLNTNDIAKAKAICGRDFQGRKERLFLVIKELEIDQEIPTPMVSEEETTPMTNRSFSAIRGSGRGSWRSRGGASRGSRGRGRGRGGFSSGFVSNSNTMVNSSANSFQSSALQNVSSSQYVQIPVAQHLKPISQPQQQQIVSAGNSTSVGNVPQNQPQPFYQTASYSQILQQ